MPGELDPAAGLLMFVGVALASVLGRFLIAFAATSGERRSLSKAVRRTGQWSYALAAGFGSAVGLGLVQTGDILGGMFGFLVAHPYFASNFGILGIGAGGLSGLWTITGQEFIGVGIAIVGLVMLTVEVDDAV